MISIHIDLEEGEGTRLDFAATEVSRLITALVDKYGMSLVLLEIKDEEEEEVETNLPQSPGYPRPYQPNWVPGITYGSGYRVDNGDAESAQ